jgi:drug/metabolite transporter (DMT)-like permease
MRKRFSIEVLALLYLLAYIPYALVVRWLASVNYSPLGRPLSGLEILPATMILSGALTLLFAGLSGWSKHAHHRKLLGVSIPWPTRWTLLSGIGTSLLLFTVPLSFTFQGVSIPFMQLLMRGDVLVIAPLVDLVSGRRVAWYSWAALLLVAAGLVLTISHRGGLHLPPLAILTVVLYALGYFVRLAVMTKIGKTGDPNATKGYFVEEKLVAIPLAVAALALISISGLGAQGGELTFGFIQIWSSNQLGAILVLSGLLVLISIFSLLILLDPRENTFCVPLERSASVLAGTAAAYILAAMALGKPPTPAELTGAILLISAIAILALGPRLRLAPGLQVRG